MTGKDAFDVAGCLLIIDCKIREVDNIIKDLTNIRDHLNTVSQTVNQLSKKVLEEVERK